MSLNGLIKRNRFDLEDPRAIDNNMVHNPMLEDPIFFRMLENSAVVSSINALLGETGILYAFTTSSMPAGGTNYSHRVHVDCPRVVPGYITNIGIIAALDDFTEENGATYFLPTSFERLDQPSLEEFMKGAERVFPKAGDIVVFNARTWHLGGQNHSTEDRHALTINCCRSYMRQRFDYPYMCEELGIQLSPLLRRIIGYNVRVPRSLQEYYVPDHLRLYLPNQG
jgi:ectoine hydroxylase-related dioxygenase (phytanoyl-CoA dioxygenase family)